MKEKIYDIIGKMIEEDRAGAQRWTDVLQNDVYKYLVTLDMGCGGTSAAVAKIDDYTSIDLIDWKYKVQKEDGKDKKEDGEYREVTDLSIPTILGYCNGRPVIGPEAMIHGEAAENFKVIPDKNNLNNIIIHQNNTPLDKGWSDYIGEAFKRVLKEANIQYNGNINKDNVLLAVAHPSDKAWEKCLDSYKNLIIVKGTGLNADHVITFSEAKAAMQYVRIEKKFSLNWKNGVIVIDLGASTIDIMYLAYGQKPIEFSITMAGQEVDRLLGHEILEKIYPQELKELKPDELPDEQFFENHRNELIVGKTRFKYAMRVMKESICSSLGMYTFIYNTPDDKTESITVDKNKLKTILSTKKFEFSCSDPGFVTYMNPNMKVKQNIRGTWYEYLENFVKYVLGQISATGNFADKIIVTGGTANLTGVEKYIQRGVNAAWPNAATQIVMLDDPADYERTVPYGSASYLTNVIKNVKTLLNFPEKLENALKGDLKQKLTSAMAEEVALAAKARVEGVIETWASLPDKDPDATVNKLKENITNMRIHTRELDPAVDKAINKAKQNVQTNTTEKEIKAFLTALSIQKAHNQPIGLNGIKIKLDRMQVSREVQKSVANLNFVSLVGFRNIIPLLRAGSNKPLKQKVRSTILNNFSKKNKIKSDLEELINQEFSKAFDTEHGFGIVEKMLEDLETDINQAMFLG